MTEVVRQPSRQSCDCCRLRKIKCILLVETNDCKACHLGKLDCTYIMPVKRRGPPPKRRRIVIDSAQTNVDNPPLESVKESTATPMTQDNTPTLRESISVASQGLVVPSIQAFCSTPVFEAIIRDYLEVIYPLVPVVHIPTFLLDLQHERHIHSRTFQMFCLGICGLVLCVLPPKFDEYRRIDGSLQFADRREAVRFIHSLLLSARPPEYFDKLSHEKWAIAYMISISNAHLGFRTRARVQQAEMDVICSEMEFHRISSYANLDHVEAQLRKKAFWLNFTSQSHVRTYEIQWDSLGDRFMFETADAELLMPLEVDDEFITAENVFAQPPGRTPLVAGFNALTMINNCVVSIIKDPSLPLLTCSDQRATPRTHLGTCECGRHIQAASLPSLIQARLRKTRNVVDDLPIELGPWSSLSNSPSNGTSGSVLFAQYESMKANIHVTHLWVQSLLLERLIASNIRGGWTGSGEYPGKERIWEMREDICQQLLHLLNNISQANLEPNGYFLIKKTRQVAATLLDSSFEEEDHISRRAKSHIQSFADTLARLDNSYQTDSRHSVWKELEGQVRASPSAF